MIDAIIKILEVIGICGLLIFGLMIVNISSGCLINIKEKGESFSKEKFIKGILKTVVLYIATCILAIVFTLLPFLNELINNIYNIQLISIESLQTPCWGIHEHDDFFFFFIISQNSFWCIFSPIRKTLCYLI